MSYTPHTITASGSTYADLKAKGLHGLIDKVLAANAGYLTRASAPLAGDVVESLKTSSGQKLAQAFGAATGAISSYQRGDLVSLDPDHPERVDSVTTRLQQLADAFKAMGKIFDEAAALIDANPGTVVTSTIGNGTNYGQKRILP